MVVGAIDPSRDIIINSKLIDILKNKICLSLLEMQLTALMVFLKKTALQKKLSRQYNQWIKKLKLNLTMIIEQIYTVFISRGILYSKC